MPVAFSGVEIFRAKIVRLSMNPVMSPITYGQTGHSRSEIADVMPALSYAIKTQLKALRGIYCLLLCLLCHKDKAQSTQSLPLRNISWLHGKNLCHKETVNAPRMGLLVPWAVSLWHKKAGISNIISSTNQSTVLISLDQWELECPSLNLPLAQLWSWRGRWTSYWRRRRRRRRMSSELWWCWPWCSEPGLPGWTRGWRCRRLQPQIECWRCSGPAVSG